MRKILKESEKTRNHISILEYLQSIYPSSNPSPIFKSLEMGTQDDSFSYYFFFFCMDGNHRKKFECVYCESNILIGCWW